VITYSIFLYLWAIVFIGGAIFGSQAMKDGAVALDNECANPKSDLYYLDKVYAGASKYLCNPGNCYCTADLTLWDETKLMTLWNETDLTIDISELKQAWDDGNWRTVIYGIKKIFGIEGA